MPGAEEWHPPGACSPKDCDSSAPGNARCDAITNAVYDTTHGTRTVSKSIGRNLIHLVFSTKLHEPLITDELNPTLFAYLTGAARGIDCPAIIVGGVADHVHMLFALNKTVALCKAVEEIKKSSSKWAKQYRGRANIYWQNGYGAFSVSPQNVPRVTAYIANQERHHVNQTVMDEVRWLLHRAGEEYDEGFWE